MSWSYWNILRRSESKESQEAPWALLEPSSRSLESVLPEFHSVALRNSAAQAPRVLINTQAVLTILGACEHTTVCKMIPLSHFRQASHLPCEEGLAGALPGQISICIWAWREQSNLQCHQPVHLGLVHLSFVMAHSTIYGFRNRKPCQIAF